MKFRQFPIISLAQQYAYKIKDAVTYHEVHDALSEAINTLTNQQLANIAMGIADETIQKDELQEKLRKEIMHTIHDAALDIWEAAHRDVLVKSGITPGLAYAAFHPMAVEKRIEEAVERLLNWKIKQGNNSIDYSDYADGNMADAMASAFSYMLSIRTAKEPRHSEFWRAIKADNEQLVIDGDILEMIQKIGRQKS